MTVFPNGDLYEGDFEKDLPHGTGVLQCMHMEICQCVAACCSVLLCVAVYIS